MEEDDDLLSFEELEQEYEKSKQELHNLKLDNEDLKELVNVREKEIQECLQFHYESLEKDLNEKNDEYKNELEKYRVLSAKVEADRIKIEKRQADIEYLSE